MTWDVLPPGYPDGAEYWTGLAWRRWEIESCVERHGGHDTRLICEMGSWEIRCAHGCGLDLDDFYPDGHDSLTCDMPVSVRVETQRYPATPSHGEEWDVWVCIEPR